MLSRSASSNTNTHAHTHPINTQELLRQFDDLQERKRARSTTPAAPAYRPLQPSATAYGPDDSSLTADHDPFEGLFSSQISTQQQHTQPVGMLPPDYHPQSFPWQQQQRQQQQQQHYTAAPQMQHYDQDSTHAGAPMPPSLEPDGDPVAVNNEQGQPAAEPPRSVFDLFL